MIQKHPINSHTNHWNSNWSCSFNLQSTDQPYNDSEFKVLKLQQDSCVRKKKYLIMLRYRTCVSHIPCRCSYTRTHTHPSKQPIH